MVRQVDRKQSGCKGLGNVVFAQFKPINTSQSLLKCHSLFKYIADHAHPFMVTIYQSSNSYFQHDNSLCHKAKFISICFNEHSNEAMSVPQWASQSPDINPIEHIWDVVGQIIHSMKMYLKVHKNCMIQLW